jgi:hypothetical protein
MDKKIKETTTAASGAVAGYGSPFPGKGKVNQYKEQGYKNLEEKTIGQAFEPAKAAVYGEFEENPQYDPADPKSRKLKRLPRKKKPMPFKRATIETKAEATLREAIRELIFLNKIKFYEEQTKVALQENKLRYIIRGLLREADEKMFDTTGQNKANEALKRLKVTFDEYRKLTSNTAQRERFKLAYVSGLMSIFEKEDKSSEVVSGGKQAEPVASLPPAKRNDLEEQGEEAAPATGEPPAVTAGKSEDMMKQQAAQVATAAVGHQGTEEEAPNELAAALSALDRDIPSILKYYAQLSNKVITINGRSTTDKQDFKVFLIGDGTKAGNIQLEFDNVDNLFPPSDAKEEPTAKPVVTSAKKEATAPLEPTTPADLGGGETTAGEAEEAAAGIKL